MKTTHPITTEAELNDLLTQPRTELVEFIRQVRSPLLVLGAGGKMGPTLAVLARRAADAAGHALHVIAVSRFNNSAARQWLESNGVETLSCDLFKPNEIARLPEAGDIIYLVGVKFGTSQNPSLTWAANTIIPTNVAERFPGLRMVALSTGNVYPLVPVTEGGATETSAADAAGRIRQRGGGARTCSSSFIASGSARRWCWCASTTRWTCVTG